MHSLHAWARRVRAERVLTRNSATSLVRFHALAASFAETFRSVDLPVGDEMVGAFWQDMNRRMAQRLLPRPAVRFLRDQLIASTMVADAGGHWLQWQLHYLQTCVPHAQLTEWVRENAVGGPRLRCPELMTSHNALHQAYHLALFRERIAPDLASINTVIEWGGGYGRMALTFRRWAPQPATYIIIDTALLASLQWLYLSAVLEPAAVVLVDGEGARICPGRINIVPLGRLRDLDRIRCDLFLSTWALSESPAVMQDWVVERSWYGARHLLLAYGSSNELVSTESRVGRLAEEAGATLVPCEYVPHSAYAFR